MGERLPCKQEVTSSTLVFSTKAVNTARTEKETLRSCLHESKRFFFCSHRANARERGKRSFSSSSQCSRTRPLNKINQQLRSCMHESERFFFCSHRANARERGKRSFSSSSQCSRTRPLNKIKNIKNFKNPLAKSISMW